MSRRYAAVTFIFAFRVYTLLALALLLYNAMLLLSQCIFFGGVGGHHVT